VTRKAYMLASGSKAKGSLGNKSGRKGKVNPKVVGGYLAIRCIMGRKEEQELGDKDSRNYWARRVLLF